MAGEKRFLTVFFKEKGIDMDEEFNVDSPNGTMNVMSYATVVEAIKVAPTREQAKIVGTLRMLDFQNKPVEPYLRHLAKALAVDLP